MSVLLSTTSHQLPYINHFECSTCSTFFQQPLISNYYSFNYFRAFNPVFLTATVQQQLIAQAFSKTITLFRLSPSTWLTVTYPRLAHAATTYSSRSQKTRSSLSLPLQVRVEVCRAIVCILPISQYHPPRLSFLLPLTTKPLLTSSPAPTSGAVLLNVASCDYCTFSLFTSLAGQTTRKAVYIDFYLHLHAERNNQAGVHQVTAKRKDATITNLRAAVEQLKTEPLRKKLKNADAEIKRIKKERIQERNGERMKLDGAKNTIKEYDKEVQKWKDRRKGTKKEREKQIQKAETTITEKYDELGVLIRH